MIDGRLTGIFLVASLTASPVQAAPSNNQPDSATPVIVISPNCRYPNPTDQTTSVTEYTGQQLDAAGVDSTQDLQYTTPGLVFKSSAGVGDPYLRGVGGTVSAAGDSGIATLIDGVYMTRSVQSLQEFYDIERVDVMKGPGSIRSVRGVVGGAISIASKDPGPFQEGYADVLYGTSDRRQLRGAINLPLPDTGLSFRLAGTLNQRDGYARNVFLNEDLDDQDYYAVRGKLRYRPSSDLDIIFSAEQIKQDDTRDLAKYPNPDIGVNGGILLGGIVPSDPRQVTANVDQNQDIENTLYSGKLNWRAAAVDVQSITAWQKTVQHQALDLDSTNVDFAANFPASDARAISQEFRIGSRQEQDVGWTTGVYFQQKDAWQKLDVRFPLAGMQNLSDSDTTNRSYAVFGELTWQFTSKWQSRAGLRYSYDEGGLALEQTIADPAGVLGMPGSFVMTSDENGRWDAVTPALGISYTPAPDTQLYADVSRGYKPGGFNAYAVQPAYDPEFLWAYETGLRASFSEDKLRLHSALFYYDYHDIQLLTLLPGAPAGTLPVIDNAPRAAVQGLEIQAWYQPVWNLGISGGATFLDARYREFVSVDPNNPATDPDHSGDTLQQAPDVSLVLGAEYKWRLSWGGDFKLAADYRYQSAVYFNPYKDQAVRQGAYSLLNARLGFQSRKDDWYTELYAHNLTDELYAQNIIRLDPAVGTVRYWGEPRTYGIRIGYRL